MTSGRSAPGQFKGNGPRTGNPNGFGKCKGEWGEGGRDSIGFRKYEVGNQGDPQIFRGARGIEAK
jgi:hypothetical protein